MLLRLLILLAGVNGIVSIDSLRFLVVGDWGGVPFYPYDTPTQTAVARKMAQVTDNYHSSFNLALGDNFYWDGVKNVHDHRFSYTFENVYHYKSLMNPWYVLAGNHDHHGNVSAQIAYTDVSKRWNFPSLYYVVHKTIPGGGSLDIIMLDTVVLCGNTKHDNVADQPPGPVHVGQAEQQWQWLEQQLAASTADYLLVAGHFPVYSAGVHGPTNCLLGRLDALLYKYRATAYLCGHDHNLQHIQTRQNEQTMHYIVSGAGDISDSRIKHGQSIPEGSLMYFWGNFIDGGFSYFEATKDNMTMLFIKAHDKHLYQTTMLPRK